jgi:hypothetical protein
VRIDRRPDPSALTARLLCQVAQRAAPERRDFWADPLVRFLLCLPARAIVMSRSKLGCWLVLSALGCSSETTTPGNERDPQPPGEASLQVALATAQSCDDVEQHLRQRTRVWMNDTLDALEKRARDGESDGCALDDAASGGPLLNGSTGNENAPTSVSETNNQVADVDEADLVKTDGQYLYLAQGSELRIVDAWPAAEAHVAARVTLPGIAKKLFVEGDRAIVYVSTPRKQPESDALFPARARDCTYGYDCDFSGDGTGTELHIFDVSDRSAPERLRTLTFPGSLIAARRVGSAVHSVVSLAEASVAGLEFPQDPSCGRHTADSLASYLAVLEKARQANEGRIARADFDLNVLAHDGDRSLGADCKDFYLETAGDGQGITTLVSLDLASDADARLSHVLSRGGAVYASAQSLYMAVRHQRPATGAWYHDAAGDEVTTLHRFRIGEDPSESSYVASGLVPGHALNQFAMDEHEGYLRIATSKGFVPDPAVESVVSVLRTSGQTLSVVGQVDHIAPTEDIRSVRFDGERGYLVTFKKTDPLFVLDLSRPETPAVVGELKIPGFSSYMHQLDATHLLALGYEADDKGEFAYFNGIQLQVFDVASPTEPRLLHKQVYGTRGSSSSALTDHLGFTFMADRNLLALPMSICDGGGNGMYGTLSFSGVVAIDVTASSGFSELGRLEEPYPAEQTGFEYGGACQDWWTDSSSVVRRTVVLDDYLYAVSDERVRVQALSELGSDVALVDF